MKKERGDGKKGNRKKPENFEEKVDDLVRIHFHSQAGKLAPCGDDSHYYAEIRDIVDMATVNLTAPSRIFPKLTIAEVAHLKYPGWKSRDFRFLYEATLNKISQLNSLWAILTNIFFGKKVQISIDPGKPETVIEGQCLGIFPDSDQIGNFYIEISGQRFNFSPDMTTAKSVEWEIPPYGFRKIEVV